MCQNSPSQGQGNGSISCLPDKHEDLSSGLQYPSKNTGAAARGCNLPARKAETGGLRSLLDNQSSQIAETRVQ